MANESGLPASSGTGAAEDGHNMLAADAVRSQGSAKDTVLSDGLPAALADPPLSPRAGSMFFKAKGLSDRDSRNQYLSVLLRLKAAKSSDFKLLVSRKRVPAHAWIFEQASPLCAHRVRLC